eukprot:CAMPEP_0172584284 /NCGR_PEP_ID=MMETSP1068-20121228/3867_1 /TAXON_ID=35684 /ORGANISM="Pseudopedinella elastica, Strain CCMP716" /LENGTH=218 /DNA_ID=CAMNT_0013378407 /DNA_START=54 /DNA_END=710 /DNA_ORIENTATION=+
MKIAPILCMSIVGSSQSTFAFVHTGNRGGTKEAHVSSRRGLQTVIVRAMPPPHSPDGSQDWKATAWEAGGGREAAEDLEHTERAKQRRERLRTRLERLTVRQVAFFAIASMYEILTVVPAASCSGAIRPACFLPMFPSPVDTLALAGLVIDLSITLGRHVLDLKTEESTAMKKRLETTFALNSTVTKLPPTTLAEVSREYKLPGHGCDYYADGTWMCS